MILAGFATSLILSPPVTGLNLPGGRTIADPQPGKARPEAGPVCRAPNGWRPQARKRRLDDIAKLRQAQGALPSRVLPAILKPQAGRPLAIGFYTNWGGKDDPSWPSLKRSLQGPGLGDARSG